MIKKYKKCLIYTLISIIAIVLLGFTIDKSIAGLAKITSQEQFLNSNADDLLNANIFPWADNYGSKGQLACFYHNMKQAKSGRLGYVHSVYDVDFDKDRGEMKIYSSMYDGKNLKRQTTYSSESKGRNIGLLAYRASKEGNAYQVWDALIKLRADNAIVNDSNIGQKANPNDNSSWGEWKRNTIKFKLPDNENEIAQYKNYKKISKQNITDSEGKEQESKEVGAEITINNKSYTVMGPFKMNFGGKGISSVTAGNATWNSSTKDQIYWNLASNIAQNGNSWSASGWSNDFNAKKSQNAITYTLNDQAFYLAVETSKIPDGEKYQVTINQEEFKYKKSRVIVTGVSEFRQKSTGSNGYNWEKAPQHMGVYLYDNNTQTIQGSISWDVKRAFKTLVINKKDAKTNNELNGAAFKIYAELKDGTKGWVSGSVDGAKVYGDTATEYEAKIEIKNLKLGTYYVYETKAPNGYMLCNQKGYMEKANGSDKLSGEWAYVGLKTLGGSESKIQVAITNMSSPQLKIVKKDSIKDIEIDGGKFKLYGTYEDGTNGWVSGPAEGTKTFGSTADEYDSNTNINQLKYGTYYIYETKAPEGYDITKQDGYHQQQEGSGDLTGDWAFLGTIVLNYNEVNDDDDGIFAFEATNKKIVSALEGDVWVDEPDTKANKTDNVYNSASKDYLKSGITVNLYNSANNLIATTVTDNNGHYTFTQKGNNSSNDQASTSGSGVKSRNYATNEADNNIYYWDLVGAYVEFIYNNKTTYNEDGTVKEYGYVAVDPFVGTDAKVNSKAQEYTVTSEKLDDNNLTGTDGANPGRAVTNKDAKIDDIDKLLAKNKEIASMIKTNDATADDLKDIPLACYYDDETFKVSNINLGLLEQYDADYSVDENLAYIKVKMKGYTYTYKYGDAPASDSKYVPTVNEQNSAKTFTGKIYPTDIAYNVAEKTDELKVYVVYSIDVKNLETMYVDNIYSEQRLYLDSLVNRYDTNRYELCTNENQEDKSDFALWKDNGNGTASYDINHEDSVYRNGIEKGKYDENGEFVPAVKTSYIQFKITNSALQKILEKSLSYEDIENAPTVATATGYHEYLRTDNAWVHNDEVRAFKGAKGTNIYPTYNDAQKKYYVHKTISKDRSSADLYLKLQLGEPRKVSGTVFEDTRTTESEADSTNLGNGTLDANENNRAQDVTVELLNKDKTTVSKLYKEKDGKVVYNADGTLPDAKVTTTRGGTYEFEGVVPGYYYIRFTYGDGTQKMMPAGTDIKSNDYRSTIINTDPNGAGDTIKNAMETDASTLQGIDPTNQTEEQRKLLEWYKYLNNSNYSTATDDLNQRAVVENYEYRDDGKVYDKTTGNEITNYPTLINAYTPMSSISIENDVNTSTDAGDAHNPNYDGFNFGIITQPDTQIDVLKQITNIKYTTQTGTTLVSANPTDRSANYVTALDNLTGGSQQVKIELEKDLMYGSSLETTYQIEVENNSVKDYIEEDSNQYGTYYKYGKVESSARLKTVTVNEIVDELDDKYDFNTEGSGECTTTIKKSSSGSTENGKVKIEKITKTNDDGSTEETNNLSMTGWSSLATQDKETLSYKVSSLLSEKEDPTYQNKAKITKISVEKLSTLKSNFNWNQAKSETVITITPPTGKDRRPIYWIAGTIALIVLGAGFVFIKKKVLTK